MSESKTPELLDSMLCNPKLMIGCETPITDKFRIAKEEEYFVDSFVAWRLELALNECRRQRYKLELENASLREWKADVEESHKRIMSEQCPTDEVHCTCVPILRKENGELKAKLREAVTDKENAIIDRQKQYKIALDLESRLAEFERQIKDGERVFDIVLSRPYPKPSEVEQAIRDCVNSKEKK